MNIFCIVANYGYISKGLHTLPYPSNIAIDVIKIVCPVYFLLLVLFYVDIQRHTLNSNINRDFYCLFMFEYLIGKGV